MTSELTVQNLAAWMHAFADDVVANEALLTDLDRQIGDADHGGNMVRGMKAVAALDASDFASARDYAKKAAMTLIGKVGGAAGPLYGRDLSPLKGLAIRVPGRHGQGGGTARAG